MGELDALISPEFANDTCGHGKGLFGVDAYHLTGIRETIWKLGPHFWCLHGIEETCYIDIFFLTLFFRIQWILYSLLRITSLQVLMINPTFIEVKVF